MPIRPNHTFALSCGAGFALAAALYWYWQADTPPAAAVAAAGAPPAWNAAIGPGTLTAGDSGSAADHVADLEEIPEGVVRVDERGQLITDVQLHNAMDSYLLHSDVASRQIAADTLRAYLKRKLPAPANIDAQALVTRYLAYMDQHDAALGRIRFVAPGAEGLSDLGAEQFAAWQAQRKTMRQAMLGATVYKEWFEAEDARCAGLLAPGRDAAQAQEALDCATELSKSFALIETEERQWTRHWALYREALRRLAERDPARRALATATLRQQLFSNDAERERALAMNTQ